MLLFDYQKLTDYLGRPEKTWQIYLVAIFAGLLLPLGFAPFEWRIFSFLSPAIWFALLCVIPNTKAFQTGYFYGLAAFGFGVSWIFNSLLEFGGASIFVAALLTGSMIAVLALYFALLAWLAIKYFRTAQFSLIFLLLVLPSLWYLQEVFRGWFLTGFPWLYLGYSQPDTYLAGYMPVLGVTATALPMAIISGGLAATIIAIKHRRLMGAGACVAVFVIGVLLYPIEWTETQNKNINVAIVQGSVPQKIKMNPDKVDVSLNTYRNLNQTISNADLIIWPETAIPDFQLSQTSFISNLREQVTRQGAALISGIFFYNRAEKKSHNSLVLIDDNTNYHEQYYFKQRLVPFGEYLPFRNVINIFSGWVNMPIADLYPAHTVQQPFSLDDYHVGASICYESAYSNIFQQQLPEANFFMNVSNDAWFGKSLAPYQHLEMLRARAVETQRWMVRSTNTGISAFINPRGYVTTSIGIDNVGIIDDAISLREGQPPYVIISKLVFMLTILFLMGRLCVLRKQ